MLSQVDYEYISIQKDVTPKRVFGFLKQLLVSYKTPLVFECSIATFLGQKAPMRKSPFPAQVHRKRKVL
jgi:hypothetical protein